MHLLIRLAPALLALNALSLLLVDLQRAANAKPKEAFNISIRWRSEYALQGLSGIVDRFGWRGPTIMSFIFHPIVSNQTSSSTDYAGSITYMSIAKVPIPAFLDSFYTSGYNTVGDLGRGMPMVVGTSTGPLARQGTDRRWWNLDVANLPDIPIGYCGAVSTDATGSEVDNTFAAQTCAAIGNAAKKKLRIRTNGGVIRLGRPGAAPAGLGGWIRTDVGVIGDGAFLSYVRNMATDDNLFYAGNYTSVYFEGVDYQGAIDPSGTKLRYSAGATIVIDATSASPINQNFGSVVQGNEFSNQRNAIKCIRCNNIRIEDNGFSEYSDTAVFLDNFDHVDNGDQVILKNDFEAGSNPHAIAVLQVAAGGLRMSDNKFGGGAHGYQMKLRQGVSTSILKIHDNSFENQVDVPILLGLDPSATAASFIGAEVTSNEITAPEGKAAIQMDGANLLTIMTIRRNRIVLVGSIPGSIGAKITGGVGLDYGGNVVHGSNIASTALQVTGQSVTGRVDGDTLLGVPIALENASDRLSISAGITREFPDVQYYAKAAEPALQSGYLTLPAFAVEMKSYKLSLVEIDAEGFTQSFGVSFYRQMFAIATDGNSITITPFAAEAAPPLSPSRTSVQGWSVDTVSSVSNSTYPYRVTFILHTKGSEGSNVHSRMQIISGNAIFRTAQ